MNKKYGKIILIGILLVVTLIISNYLGYQRAIRDNNLVNKNYYNPINNVGKDEINYGTTFYATIKEKRNNTLLVKGLEINDINYREEYTFDIKSETKLVWNNMSINISDLKVGDNISITYIGTRQMSSPATINDVVEIKLLKD